MEKIKFTLIFFIAIISSLNIQGQVYESKLTPIDFPDFGISMSLPENWNYTDGSKNIKTKIFKSYYKENSNQTPYNTVSLSLSYNKIDAKPDSIFTLLQKTLESQDLNKKLIEYPINSIRGRPTRAYKTDFIINEIKITSIKVFFIENKTLFSFNSTVFTEKFDKYEDIINKVFKSINIHEFNKSTLKSNQEYKIIDKNYSNEKYGFEIKFPLGWFYIEDFMSNVVLVKKAGQDTTEFISMGIDIHNEIELSAKEFNQAYLRKIQEQMLIAKDNKELKPYEFKHPIYEAYKSSYLSSFNKMKLMVFVYSVIKNKKGYVFMTATDLQHLHTNEKLFDKTFESFELK
jgi:hypothetical protein